MAKKKSLRARTRIEQNAFVKGLITEASPLTFPDNASLDEENFFLNRDGSRQRRLGLEYEIGHIEHPVEKEDTQFSDIDTFIWEDASNTRQLNIAVVRTGEDFYFFYGDAESVSSSPLQVVDLDGNTLPIGEPLTIPGISINGAPLDVKYDYSFAHGRLVVTSGQEEITIISYSVDTNLVTAVQRRLKIRDHFGVEETINSSGDRYDFRPVSVDAEDPLELDIQHRYNLRNQGWREQLDCATNDGVPAPDVDTIKFTAEQIGVYPSNADMVWAHKLSEGTVEPLAIGSYSPIELKKSTYGRYKAPRGRYILDLFERGAERKRLMSQENPDYDITSIPVDRTIGGVSAVTTYVGRLVYAVNEIEVIEEDDRTPSIGSMILFSKATENLEDFNQCYADGDPTAGDEFSPLATDGGFFTLTGLGHVNNMEVIGNSLFIFSDRGVWQVNGGDRLFTATNINSSEATQVGNIGRNATVVAENNIFYLSDAGIYVLPVAQEARSSEPINITQGTIQSFWENIPESNRQFIVASYDRFARQVKWLIRRGETPNRNFYDTELIYDLNLEAFFVYSFKEVISDGGTPYVVGFLERNTIVQAVDEIQIVGGLDLVVVGEVPELQSVVVQLRKASEDFVTSNKYWTLHQPPGSTTGRLTVAEYKNLSFRDWSNTIGNDGLEGVDASAYLLTGYATAGDSSVFKRVSTITTHMRRTETQLFAVDDGFIADNPSSCMLQGQWEWTDHPDAGRWTNPQQAYRLPRTFVPDDGEFDYGYTVVSSKLNLRGKGRALSLLFHTEPYKDCHLYGWSLELNAEQDV